MNGKILMGGLVAFTVIFGAALFYFQVYAFYDRVEGLTSLTVQDREIAVQGYEGIDAETSGLKLRGCFTTDPAAYAGLSGVSKPTPLSPPFWFDCFDQEQLQQDIDAGLATVYLAAENEKDGIDRVVAVYPDGRAYQWRQLNEKYQD